MFKGWFIILTCVLLAGCGFSNRSDDSEARTSILETTDHDARKDQVSAVDVLIADFESDFSDWLEKFRNAQPSDTVELVKSSPKATYLPKFKKIASETQGTEDAAKALSWLAANTFGLEQQSVLDLLFEDYRESKAIHRVAETLVSKPCQSNHDQLQMLYENSRHEIVKATCLYSLVQMIESAEMFNSNIEQIKVDDSSVNHFGTGGIKYIEEISRLKDAKLDYMRVIQRDFAGITIEFRSRKVNLGQFANAAFFEMNSLKPGCEAPEIEGEDLSGKSFKLSEYRGQVVMLYFWGHW